MAMLILTVCGAGVGTSEILRVTATRALQRLGIDADVTATDAEHVAAIGRTYAQVIVVEHILDQAEVERKLADALE